MEAPISEKLKYCQIQRLIQCHILRLRLRRNKLVKLGKQQSDSHGVWGSACETPGLERSLKISIVWCAYPILLMREENISNTGLKTSSVLKIEDKKQERCRYLKSGYG